MAKGRYTESGEESPKVKITRESLRESAMIFGYLKPYRFKFAAALGFIALSAGTTMAFPYLLKTLIDSAHGSLILPFRLPFQLTTGRIAVAMMALLTLQMLISFMRVYLFTLVGENAVADMRKDIYRKLITMPMDFFANRRVGELSSRITADISQIQDTVTNALAEMLRGFLTLIIGLGLILYISVKMTLLMLSVIPVILLVGFIFSKRIRTIARETQDQLADSGTVVQETLQGISNVKTFTNEWYEIGRYNKSITSMVSLAIRNGRLRGFFVSFLLFTVFGAIVLVVWYGAGLMQQGALSFGDLMAFVVYTAFVGGTMAGFAELYSQFQKTLGATQRVREILKDMEEPVSINPETLPEKYKLKGNVSFANISFSYPSRTDNPVLKDISFSVDKGRQVAIVGPSGAGKSTLISLLLGFYKPTGGTISFDDKNAVDIPITNLRQQIALVPQDILLFGGTIYENIAYGRHDANEAEVMEAARKANAHDFIMSFPEGYKTVVGERGVKLSGGQRQRVAIARALLKDPVILLLDEATSSLDSESEMQVQEALQNLMKNRTSFVVAHRLSTIRNADMIMVLEDGMIKESGTHEELLAIHEGLYKYLAELQIR